jgi:CubicO group peptidase (beta-lactamase class C family)
VYHRGREVVHLWGGFRDVARQQPWREDTLAPLFSTTKGVAGLAVALAHSRGLLDYDAPVAHYWPEFSAHGKHDITVRDLLAHRAGLCAVDRPLTPELLADPDALAEILADQKPAWRPGSRYGYHGITLGLYQSALLRQIDPRRRTIGRFVRDEIAGPLGLDIHIGTPPELTPRVAELLDKRSLRGLRWRLLFALLWPPSLTARALRNPDFRRPTDVFSPRYRGVELPSSNGVGRVRDVARLFGLVAAGGKELGLRPETLAELAEAVPAPAGLDAVLHVPLTYHLGFMKSAPGHWFSANPRAYGAAGLGGSFGFVDPDLQLGFAYVPNRLGGIARDPRETALRTAAQRAASRLDHLSEPRTQAAQRPE